MYKNDYNVTMSAAHEMKLLELTRGRLNNRIKQSSPSDIITLTRKEDLFLLELWMGEGKVDDIHYTPSDIVFADTIPMTDCIIEIDERGYFENGQIVRYRVIIFEEEVKTAKEKAEAHPDMQLVIGAIIMDNPVSNVFYLPIVVSARSIYGLGVCPIAKNEKADLLYNNAEALRVVADGMPPLLFTWYGIQIALLHPDVKEVFKHPSRQIANAGTGKGERQRKVKYIRKHILKLEELENAAHTNEARKYNRKCLVWYVIGHWREYPTGKRVFIKPYWKGVLRQTKRNMDGDDRIRII